MNIVDLITLKYPMAKIGVMGEVTFAEDDRGVISIDKWNLPDPKPSQEDLDAWAADPTVLAAHQKIQNDIINKPIYDQLEKLDIKSIRALRSKDNIRLDQYEAEAAALRAQLVK